MRNINEKLQQQESFCEVREAFRRIRNIKMGRTYLHEGNSVNNRRPESFNLIKKLGDNRRPNTHVVSEHVRNLASLSRRLNSLNNLHNRKKNPNDPVLFPTKVRRPGGVPQDTKVKGLSKRIEKQDVRHQK